MVLHLICKIILHLAPFHPTSETHLSHFNNLNTKQLRTNSNLNLLFKTKYRTFHNYKNLQELINTNKRYQTLKVSSIIKFSSLKCKSSNFKAKINYSYQILMSIRLLKCKFLITKPNRCKCLIIKVKKKLNTQAKVIVQTIVLNRNHIFFIINLILFSLQISLHLQTQLRKIIGNLI